MSLSVLRPPATRFKAGVSGFRVRRGIALTDQIAAAVVFHGASPLSRCGTELLTQSPVVRFTGGPQVSAGPAGLCFAGTTSISAITSTEGSPGFVFSTTSLTLAVLRRATDATVRSALIAGNNTATSGQRYGMSNNTSDLATGVFGTTSQSGAYIRTQALEAWVLVAGTTGMHLYVNNQVIINTTTPLTRSASTGGLCLNNGLQSGLSDNQEIYLALLLNREWTPAEVMAWTLAPFSVLEPAPANYAALVSAAPSGVAGRLVNRPPLTSLVGGGLVA